MTTRFISMPGRSIPYNRLMLKLPFNGVRPMDIKDAKGLVQEELGIPSDWWTIEAKVRVRYEYSVYQLAITTMFEFEFNDPVDATYFLTAHKKART